MATFKYSGRTNAGAPVEGIVQAVDKTAAAFEIRKTVDVIESIKAVEETPDILGNLFKRKITVKDLVLICKQFAIILHAGLPLATAIKLIGNQTEEETMKKLLLDVCEDVKGGASLGDSFEKRNPELPTTFTETIRAGEASGKLDVAFDRLAGYFSRKNTAGEKVKSALIYPIIVIIVAVVVIAILMIFAVPKFTETFAGLGAELPFATKALIGVSNFFVKWIWAILLVIVIIAIAYKVYTSTKFGKYIMSDLSLRVPILGKIRRMSSASEFANCLSTMLASGIPAIKALNITAKAITNFSISQDVLEACELVEGGYKIGESLKEKTELPDLLIEVIGIGENSGSLEHTLSVISEFYDGEIENATANALAVLEPALILGLAVIVIFILLAVYLPMFAMYGSF